MHEQVGAAQQRVELGVGRGSPGSRRRASGASPRPAITSRWPVPSARARPPPGARGSSSGAGRRPPAMYGSPSGGGQRPDRQRGRVGDHAHLAGGDPVALADVIGGEPRDADDPLGRAHGARRESAGTSGRCCGRSPGVLLEGQVVDRDHARARTAQRQEAVGDVDDVGAHPRQQPGQAHLLERAPRDRGRRRGSRAGRRTPEGPARARRRSGPSRAGAGDGRRGRRRRPASGSAYGEVPRGVGWDGIPSPGRPTPWNLHSTPHRRPPTQAEPTARASSTSRSTSGARRSCWAASPDGSAAAARRARSCTSTPTCSTSPRRTPTCWPSSSRPTSSTATATASAWRPRR